MSESPRPRRGMCRRRFPIRVAAGEDERDGVVPVRLGFEEDLPRPATSADMLGVEVARPASGLSESWASLRHSAAYPRQHGRGLGLGHGGISESSTTYIRVVNEIYPSR